MGSLRVVARTNRDEALQCLWQPVFNMQAGNLFEVAGLHRRLRGGIGERGALPPASQPAPHLHRVASAGEYRRRTGSLGRPAAGAGAAD